MTEVIRLIKKSELTDVALTWTTNAGQVIDFSVGYTFELKVGAPGLSAAFTKTSGITGAATSPNITIQFSPNELDNIPSGLHIMQLRAHHVASNKDRSMSGWIRFKDAIN